MAVVRLMMRRRERGATIVETALLAPVFIMLVIGVIEMGYLLRDHQITSDSVSDGSRTAALMGPSMAEDGSSPDFQIVRALRDATGSMGPDWVRRIVIFQADGPSSGDSAEDQVPDDCKAGVAVAGVCNVYNDPVEAFLAVEDGDAEYFACPDSDVACSWPAADRKNGPTVDDVDYIGVWIRVQRPYLTGLFGSEITLEQASVVRVEVGSLTG